MLPNDFRTLSRSARHRVLGEAAREAMTQFPLTAQGVRLHASETNALFRVETANEKYILRLATPGWRTRENLESEALWLKALESVPQIHAPRIIPNAVGDATSLVRSSVYDIEWIVTMMSWQPGRLLGFYLTPDNLHKMGGLFARLHIHAADWNRPPEFSSHIFDTYLSRGEKNILVKPEGLAPLGEKDVALIRRTIARVTAAYKALDRDDIRVIHCDLWHDNIKLYRGDLYPFDFEDTILGFRLHDIAMAMLDLLDDTDVERYPVLLDAFRTGYEELLEWPAGDMAALQAGRILWIINYMLRVAPNHVAEVMKRRRNELENLEKTGSLIG